MSKNAKHTSTGIVILSLMLVLFIDGMGQGLIFPILVKAFLYKGSYHFLAGNSDSWNTFVYGMVLGSFFIAWFFGSLFLGDFSDSIGRKKGIIICLAGSLIGFILSAIAFPMHSLSMLLIGRLIDGFTAGSQPIAQAAIIDIGSKKYKARNIGLILVAVSIGLVAGPIIGGFLSDSRLVSWFNLSTPFYFGAILSFINILLLFIIFRETRKATKKFQFKWSKIINVFTSAVKDKAVFYLLCSLFFVQLAWAMYFVYLPAYLANHFHQSGNAVAIFNALIGLGLATGLGISSITHILTKYFSAKWLVAIGYGVLPIGIVVYYIFPFLSILWISVLFIAAAAGFGYSVILSMFSNLVDSNRQGWIMGLSSSFIILAFTVASFSSGVLGAISQQIPLIIIICSGSIGCIFITLFRYRQVDN